MTTYEFEVAAKNAIITATDIKYGEQYAIQDISTVWLCYILGNKKGLFIDNGANKRYYEVTRDEGAGKMYLDIYEKSDNIQISQNAISTLVKTT